MTTATNLPREADAFLDAVAVGESAGDYTVLYGGEHFDDSMPSRDGYFGFPDWSGKDNSHAAGRYQFEPETWKETASGLFPAGSTPNFRNPGDQDWGAWLLAQRDFKARSTHELLAFLRSGLLTVVATTLQTTWTSLSPDTFPQRYQEALASIPAPPAPAPAPTPAPAPAPSPYEAILATLTAKRDKLDAAIAAIKALMV